MNQPGNQGDRRVGSGMLWLAAIGLLAGLTFVFSGLMPERGGIVSQSSEGGRAMVMVERDPSGHYFAEGGINGRPVVFLLDTGATDVAVSERLARSMGLDFGPQVTVQTAAGPARAWVTRLDRVTLGNLSRSNVRATITPGLGDEALLGMSFLKHYSLRQEGQTLVIASAQGAGA